MNEQQEASPLESGRSAFFRGFVSVLAGYRGSRNKVKILSNEEAAEVNRKALLQDAEIVRNSMMKTPGIYFPGNRTIR